MWLILANLTDTAIQAHCIKAALSIIKWVCRKISRNYKTLNRKASDMLRSPMNSVVFDCFNSSVLVGFPAQSLWVKELKCQSSLVPCSLPKAIEIVAKTCPVSLWWLPSWLTLRQHVKSIFADSLSTFSLGYQVHIQYLRCGCTLEVPCGSRSAATTSFATSWINLFQEALMNILNNSSPRNICLSGQVYVWLR